MWLQQWGKQDNVGCMMLPLGRAFSLLCSVPAVVPGTGCWVSRRRVRVCSQQAKSTARQGLLGP